MRSHSYNKAIRRQGSAVAGFLNTERLTSDGRKLAELLAKVHQAACVQREAGEYSRSLYGRNRRVGFTSQEKARRDSLLEAARRAANDLDAEWKRVVGLPCLFGFDFSGGMERMVFTYADPQARMPLTPLRSQSNALWLLAREGFLHRIRRCLHCKKWLFAGKESQKCCSTPCRLAFHKSSPEYKARHREEMRRLRAAEKQRNEPFQLRVPKVR